LPDEACLVVPALGPAGWHLKTAGQALAATGPAGVRATEVLLLAACGAVRLARAWLSAAGDTPVVGWEAGLPPKPGPRQLDHALTALSAACRLTVREIEALADEALAERYLALRGFVL
jgi:hypothetical protein